MIGSRPLVISPGRIKFRVYYGLVGLLIGVSVFFSFNSPAFNNMTAASIGLASGLFAALYSFVHHVCLRMWPEQDEADQMSDQSQRQRFRISNPSSSQLASTFVGKNPSSPMRSLLVTSPYIPPVEVLQSRMCALRFFRILGWTGVVCGLALFGGFTYVSVQQQQKLSGASDWMSVVWAFMVIKWAAALLWHLRHINPFCAPIISEFDDLDETNGPTKPGFAGYRTAATNQDSIRQNLLRDNEHFRQANGTHAISNSDFSSSFTASNSTTYIPIPGSSKATTAPPSLGSSASNSVSRSRKGSAVSFEGSSNVPSSFSSGQQVSSNSLSSLLSPTHVNSPRKVVMAGEV